MAGVIATQSRQAGPGAEARVQALGTARQAQGCSGRAGAATLAELWLSGLQQVGLACPQAPEGTESPRSLS